MFNIKEKGLTGFNLKYLALIFMVLDHVHYFFEFTGKIPIVFSWIGRLTAPLFLFCFVEGFLVVVAVKIFRMRYVWHRSVK